MIRYTLEAKSHRARFNDKFSRDEGPNGEPYFIVGTASTSQCCRWNPSTQKAEWFLILDSLREVPLTLEEVDVNGLRTAEARAKEAYETWESENFDENGERRWDAP